MIPINFLRPVLCFGGPLHGKTVEWCGQDFKACDFPACLIGTSREPGRPPRNPAPLHDYRGKEYQFYGEGGSAWGGSIYVHGETPKPRDIERALRNAGFAPRSERHLADREPPVKNVAKVRCWYRRMNYETGMLAWQIRRLRADGQEFMVSFSLSIDELKPLRYGRLRAARELQWARKSMRDLMTLSPRSFGLSSATVQAGTIDHVRI